MFSVSYYVLSCLDCQLAKPASHNHLGLQSSQPSTRSWKCIHVDYVGPMIKSFNGNIGLLSIMDTFYKFIFLQRIAADVTVNLLVIWFLVWWALPRQLCWTIIQFFWLKPVMLCVLIGESGIVERLLIVRIPPMWSDSTEIFDHPWSYFRIPIKQVGISIFHLYKLRSTIHGIVRPRVTLVHCFWVEKFCTPCSWHGT